MLFLDIDALYSPTDYRVLQLFRIESNVHRASLLDEFDINN